jgi:predicted nucleic-acid-binding Zn-ribbon protein
MIPEPESRHADHLKDGGNLVRHYMVEHDGVQHKCHTLAYASYLAEKFNAKVWNVVLEKFVTPHIGKCGYCKTYSKLHFVDGNRGSLPPEDDSFGCDKCGSVYRIIDILMETDAYKTNP